MTEYKLFNTDGKTFFDFRSNPDSRCEGFTLSYLDDGTVVLSGDYGTLCWKRNYHHAEGDFDRDYGFPNKETNIGYFAEKVCQFGIGQKIEEWSKEKAIEEIKEYLKDDKEVLDKILDDAECLEEWEDQKFREIVSEHDENGEYYEIGIQYTYHFKFVFELLKSVSEQVWEEVKKAEVKT